MAKIGTFKTQGDKLVGTVHTLTLNLKVSIEPVERVSENSPDYRVFAGSVEIGAAWKQRSARSDRDYLSVTLDDPSFPAAVYPRMIPRDDGTHELVWNRYRPA